MASLETDPWAVFHDRYFIIPATDKVRELVFKSTTGEVQELVTASILDLLCKIAPFNRTEKADPDTRS